jgi:phosphate transport system substrate-binding protein
VNTPKRRLVLAGFVSLALLASACGEDEGAVEETSAPTTADSGEPTTTAAGGDGMELAGGEVFITGSSTVEPVTGLVSELADEMSSGALAATVEGPGTGDGFKKFCGGEADITGASRPIKDEELATCTENGVEFVELEIAFDGLTVATSPNNSAVECLDTAALYALIGPESEGFTNWSDANTIAGELGSAYAELPDAPLVITGPGPESGTYDAFVEFAIADSAEARGTEETTRVDYTQSPNDNLIVEGIEGSDTSLGWLGFAFYIAEGDKMKAVAVDAGEGCVLPTIETIADGSYGFSRSLYVYVSKQSAMDNPAVVSYVDLLLADEGIAQVSEAGYVQLPADRLEATRTAWAAATS